MAWCVRQAEHDRDGEIRGFAAVLDVSDDDKTSNVMPGELQYIFKESDMDGGVLFTYTNTHAFTSCSSLSEQALFSSKNDNINS